MTCRSFGKKDPNLAGYSVHRLIVAKVCLVFADIHCRWRQHASDVNELNPVKGDGKMALVVNTNVGSLNAQRQLAETTRDMSTAMERLSSGKRINSAADDAAGLAISTRMTSQVKGLNMAIRNANDGISLTQSAEGAMQEVTDMLQRMRELAVQSSSGVNSDSDRESLNNEVSQLKAEIDRVANTTRFNNVNILDGSYATNIQIGDNADQSMSIGISAVNVNAMGETSDGVAESATAAELTITGMKTDAAAYAGKSFQVEVNGVTSTVTLPTADETENTAAAVQQAFAGSDTGVAASVIYASDAAGYIENTIDLSTHADRVFAIRNDRSEMVNIDFTDELANVLGVTRAELDAPATYSSSSSDKVYQSEFLAAVQATLDADANLQGDNRVIASVDDKGQIVFSDINGNTDRIVMGAGQIDGTATAGSFAASFVDATIAGAVVSNTVNDVVDFETGAASAGRLSAAFRVQVNDDTEWTTIDFNDKLNDSSYVYDRDNILAYELVNVLQAEFDENFTGGDAVTVGLDAEGRITLQVAGDGTNESVTISDTQVDVAGTMTATTGALDIFGVTATNDITIDNTTASDGAAVTINNISTALDGLNNPDPWAAGKQAYSFQARLNGQSAFTQIGLTELFQDSALVADPSDISRDELVAVLQAGFDAAFGDDAVGVSMTSQGFLKFDPAGQGILEIEELDDGVTGAAGTFVANYIHTGATLTVNEFVDVEADSAGKVGDVSFSTVVSDTGVDLVTIGFGEEEGSALAAAGSRVSAFGTNLYTGVVGEEWTANAANNGINTGITVAAAETLTFTIAGTAKTAVSITAGTYATLDDLAAEMQMQIDRSGNFQGDDALTVSVETFTDGDNTDFGQNVSYLAISNAAGKYVEVAAAQALTAYLGAETDTNINDTTHLQELGIRPDDTVYSTSGRIAGGVNTADNDLVMTVEKGGNTFSYSLDLTEDNNLTFSQFGTEVVSKANEAFAAHGISFSGGFTDGQFSLVMDQAGASTLTLSGGVADLAFGGSVTVNGTDASNGLADMSAVAAEITADLTAAGVVAEFDEQAQALVIRDESGAVGAASSISLSGDDLADLEIAGALSATGTASNATAQNLSLASVATVEDATAALASIDNALEYISSQRSELGAIENRLNHTVNNLMNVVENTSASRSRIEDADYAVESANLAKLQVMQQAGTAMLAQANASGQLVLSLLG